MSWWWGKDSRAAAVQPTDSISDSPSPLPEPRGLRELADKPTTSTSQDAQWEKEMERFLHESAEPERARTTRASTDAASTVTSASTPHAPTNDRMLTPERLYPDSMTCRAAFDRAFYCQSIGGQFNNVYRYGGLRDCHDNWAEFWFCMRVRGRSGESKRQRIREFYAERDERYRQRPSSEDVWEKRTTMLDKAFDMDVERSTLERG